MEKDIGYRKIQRTGRGYYIISLPKEWIQNFGLEKGNQLDFKILEDSSLLLVPRKVLEGKKKDEELGLKEYRIIVDPKENPESVIRKIIALYTISADLIHIRFKKEGIPSEHKAALSNIKKMLFGSEIIDETSREVTFQILINHSVFPVEKAIWRMTILALSANREAILALENMDENLIKGITEACEDVKRLNLYVIRQLKYGLEQKLFQDFGFKTPKEFLGYRIVANNIEGITDNSMNVANNLMTLKKLLKEQLLIIKETIDNEILSQILEFNAKTHHSFEESLKALFGRNYEQAEKLISELKPLISLENELITRMYTKKMDPNLLSIFRLILDNSRRIVEYSKNIAEVTLNRTVEEISQLF